MGVSPTRSTCHPPCGAFQRRRPGPHALPPARHRCLSLAALPCTPCVSNSTGSVFSPAALPILRTSASMASCRAGPAALGAPRPARRTRPAHPPRRAPRTPRPHPPRRALQLPGRRPPPLGATAALCSAPPNTTPAWHFTVLAPPVFPPTVPTPPRGAAAALGHPPRATTQASRLVPARSAQARRAWARRAHAQTAPPTTA